MSIREIRIEDYTYELPENRIARYPLENRDQSNLLVFSNGQISHKHFYDLPGLLPSDSLLIWNNTKVIPARLQFRKTTGALIEIFLLEPVQPSEYAEMFRQTGSCIWDAIVGNQKKWKGDSLIRAIESPDGTVCLSADNINEDGKNRILLKWTPENL
ncbi:MAG: S-adenosylmethionine:tRNA ribosyltransferase-isomerase, partial [Bacteroidales bacterium]|nr:S-adenosylmethionine:tRNA ribosyltransferase-isomerase [Bacteroidales bacterium]